MWSIISLYLLHILQIGSVPFFMIQAWYDHVAKLWSGAAIIRPSVSVFSLVLLSHLLVLFWSTSASLVFSLGTCDGMLFFLSSSSSLLRYYCYFNVMMHLCLECGWNSRYIDLIHKWRLFYFRSVIVQISLPSLTLEQEFFSI